ncbi:hypothetical protein JYU14_00540 [Simkania negevensis]|uniref:Uncharacterized protein n=1 Tax=Simkania negevensis TaxID=83561 RepID=A0ABS3AQK6_9BACT|nr:hypothetical protein [Simkania negevensis]
MITTKQLREWNDLGLFPNETEDEAAFVKRVRDCLYCSNQFEEYASSLPLVLRAKRISKIQMSPALALLQKEYGIYPDWMIAVFSNKGLASWHGGRFCLHELKEHHALLPIVQVRRELAKGKHYLTIYSLKEILAHEGVHLCRMAFTGTRYEETLAYFVSTSRIRKWLGPLFTSPIEAMIFVALVFVGLIAQGWTLLSGHLEYYPIAMWIQLFPLALIAWGGVRLASRYRKLKKCLNNLCGIFRNKKHSQHILYRLSDAEIDLFAKRSPGEIVEYAKEKKCFSLRWQLIWQAYFSRSKQ